MMNYNLVIIFVIGKYFWDGSVDVDKKCRIKSNFCICYYFYYGIIFVVYSWSFKGMSKYVWEDVDYPTDLHFKNIIFWQKLEVMFIKR